MTTPMQTMQTEKKAEPAPDQAEAEPKPKRPPLKGDQWFRNRGLPSHAASFGVMFNSIPPGPTMVDFDD